MSWGDWGEGKKKMHKGWWRGEERKCHLVLPLIVLHALAIISIIAILIEMPSGSFFRGERYKGQMKYLPYIIAQLLIMKFDSKTALQYVLQLN